MKKLFKGEYRTVFEYLLNIGPLATFWLINVIAAAVAAVAMAALIWWQSR
jgi:hypothetical protein